MFAARSLLCAFALCVYGAYGAALPPLEASEFEVAPDVTPTSGDSRELQEATKDVSIWGMAKRFFTVREKIKAKQSGAAATATPTAMPKDFGVGYKHMLEWYCGKSENTAKALCTKKAESSGNVLAGKPPMGDSVAAVKSYCMLAENKAKSLCTMSKLMGHHVAAAAAQGAATATAGASAAPGANAVAKPAGSMSKEAKVAKKGAKKAAKSAPPQA